MGKCRVHGSRLSVLGGEGRGRIFVKKNKTLCSFRKCLLQYENFGVSFVIDFIYPKLKMEIQMIVNFYLQNKKIGE